MQKGPKCLSSAHVQGDPIQLLPLALLFHVPQSTPASTALNNSHLPQKNPRTGHSSVPLSSLL